MIIWKMIIWWLFDDYLMVTIRDYLMIIRFPRQQQVVWFASFPKAFAWNSESSGWWQPFPWHFAACESRLLPAKLRFICNNNLVFHGCLDEPSSLPHSARIILLQEIVDPAIKQNLTVSRTLITNLFSSCDGVAFNHPCVLRMQLSTLTWNNENNYNNCNITIFNNLVHHLLSVFCAFEAQVPEIVIHKMQHLLVEKKKISEFHLIRLVHTPNKLSNNHQIICA